MIAFIGDIDGMLDGMLLFAKATLEINCPVGVLCGDDENDGRPAMKAGLQLELVYVNEAGLIVGTEADDYEPDATKGERPAILIS